MSSILVTGAGGFVGRHVCAALTARGHAVTAHLGPLDQVFPASARRVQSDILDQAVLQRAADQCEVVIHAAGPPSVAQSYGDPVQFAQVHVAGTAQVMHCASVAGIRRWILVSSAEIYGTSRKIVDEASLAEPQSPYGAAKLGAEWMARTLAGATGARLSIVRPFSLYGPGMREQSLMQTILRLASSGEPMELAALGPVRDHLHIDDFTQLIECLVRHPDPPAVINACSGEGLSVGEIARLALKICGRTDEPSETGRADRPADVSALVGRRASAGEFPWAPTITLKDGMMAMLAR